MQASLCVSFIKFFADNDHQLSDGRKTTTGIVVNKNKIEDKHLLGILLKIMKEQTSNLKSTL